MSLENTAVAEAPVSGSETTPAAPAASNENTSRYEGFSSPDVQEPVEANQNEQTQEATTEQPAEAPETPESEGAEPSETTETEPDPWAGYEEVEIDGKTLKIPAEAKEYLLRQADYTRKTQEVAARSKELDAREEQVTQRQKISENEIEAYVALSRVGEQIKEFENVNWNAEFARARAADDPIALGDLNAKWAQFQGLRSLQQEGVGYLNEAANKRTEMAQQDTAKRHAATEAFAAKNIKGWNADYHRQIVSWAGENGIDEATLKAAYTPQVYSLLDKAFKWDQSLKRQQSAKPSPITAQVKPAPTTNVSAKANVVRTFDAEASSMDDYAKDWAARQKRR